MDFNELVFVNEDGLMPEGTEHIFNPVCTPPEMLAALEEEISPGVLWTNLTEEQRDSAYSFNSETWRLGCWFTFMLDPDHRLGLSLDFNDPA